MKNSILIVELSNKEAILTVGGVSDVTRWLLNGVGAFAHAFHNTVQDKEFLYLALRGI